MRAPWGKEAAVGRGRKPKPRGAGGDAAVRKCLVCAHWVPGRAPCGIREFSAGACRKNGYSSVPPVFSCGAFERGPGDEPWK